jgi:hypothetical protein
MNTLLWRCHKCKKTLKVCSAHSLIAPTCHTLCILPPLALTFWQPSTPSQCEQASNPSLASCSPMPKCLLVLQSPPPMKHSCCWVEPVPKPTSVPLQAASQYKHACSVEPPAINADFEIDPMANAGMLFTFDEAVQEQCHRHTLNVGECEECHKVHIYFFYNSFIPIPPKCC